MKLPGTGEPGDNGRTPRERFPIRVNILMLFLIGFAVNLIAYKGALWADKPELAAVALDTLKVLTGGLLVISKDLVK